MYAEELKDKNEFKLATILQLEIGICSGRLAVFGVFGFCSTCGRFIVGDLFYIKINVRLNLF